MHAFGYACVLRMWRKVLQVLQYDSYGFFFFFKLRGTLPGENAHELTNRLMELKSELEDLEEKEHMLDQQKFWVEQSIRNTSEDCSKYPFCKKKQRLYMFH